jgi:putative addiction module component (TIGR02574 family)
MPAIYDQIKQMTRTERLDLVQEIWNGLAQESDTFELTVAQAVELDRRLAQHLREPASGGTSNELAARLGVGL